MRAPVNVILILCGCMVWNCQTSVICASNSTAAWHMRLAAVRNAILAKLGINSLPTTTNSTQGVNPTLLAAYNAAVISSKRVASSNTQVCGGESLFAKTILFYVPISYTLSIPAFNKLQWGKFRLKPIGSYIISFFLPRNIKPINPSFYSTRVVQTKIHIKCSQAFSSCLFTTAVV